jgi:hypothetical protein
VEKARALRLARLIDQRYGLADQLGGTGGVASRVGRLRAARQQRQLVHARSLLGR